MRLGLKEKTVLEKLRKKVIWDMFLFWSRVDINKKWGDIDIIILNEDTRKSNLELSLELEMEFFKEIEEKIDIVVFSKRSMTTEQKLFLSSINKVEIWIN